MHFDMHPKSHTETVHRRKDIHGKRGATNERARAQQEKSAAKTVNLGDAHSHTHTHTWPSRHGMEINKYYVHVHAVAAQQ